MDLARFYRAGGALVDSNGDDFPDGVGVRLVLGDEATAEEGRAAAHIAARLGLEVMGLDLPLAVTESSLERNEARCLVVVGTHNSWYRELCHEYPDLWMGIDPDEGLIQYVRWPPPAGMVLVAGRTPRAMRRAGHYLATLRDSRAKAGSHTIFSTATLQPLEAPEPLERLVIGAEGDAPLVPPIGTDGKPLCLTRLWTGLSPLSQEHQVPCGSQALLVLPRRALAQEYAAAANWAARWGLETAGLDFPMVIVDDEWSDAQGTQCPLLLVGRHNLLTTRLIDEGRWRFPLSTHGLGVVEEAFGAADAMILWGSHVATLPPATYPGGIGPWDEIKQELVEWLSPQGEGGAALSCLRALDAQGPELAGGGRFALDVHWNQSLSASWADSLARCMAKLWGLRVTTVHVHDQAEPRTVLQEQHKLVWEVHDAQNELERLLGTQNTGRPPLHIDLRLSENACVRQNVAEKVKTFASQRGIDVEVTVRSAHKQGYSWLKEEILPRLREHEVSRVNIEFLPFEPETDPWIDVPVFWLEQGKPEKERRLLDLAAVMEEMKEYRCKWLGLPLRNLCELYPIDEEMACALSVPADRITFEEKGHMESTYRVRAHDAAGKEILAEEFTVSRTSADYLQAFPDWGRVHIESSWLTVHSEDEVLVDVPLASDLLRAWQCFQQFLVRLKDYLLEEYDGVLTPSQQPFFDQLVFETWLSEPNERIGHDEELFSTLEALHEDIYFVALDFFRALGQESCGVRLEAPGQIIPRIHEQSGSGGRVNVHLTRSVAMTPHLQIKDKTAKNQEQLCLPLEVLPPISVVMEGCERHEGHRDRLVFRVTGLSSTDWEKLAAWPSAGLSGTKPLDVVLRGPEDAVSWSLTPEPTPLSHDQRSVPVDAIIDQETQDAVLAHLRMRPELEVYRVGRSLQGRDIMAISMVLPTGTQWRSQVKTALFKPTYHINNRHHANEVSATNGALWLLERCLVKEEDYRWLRRLNICAIPMENVDGAALHYELQKEHPHWMLHAARYNAQGLEFASEYHVPDTPVSEALALPSNWASWLPDIMVDCHERPSHEWRQLFSGYTPVSWPYLWILPSFFTGIMHYVDSDAHAHHLPLAQMVRSCVVDAINHDEEIRKRNLSWQRRYEKYAHAYMPDKFPKEQWEDVQFHFQGVKPSSSASSFCGRYPQITALNWVTEVAAETPQGEFLRLCARTHLVANRAVLALMAQADYVVERCWHMQPEGTVCIWLHRPRPLRWD